MKKRLGPIPLLIPMPAVLVGTFNTDGTPNAMTAAWAGICCQKPPCLGVAIRQSRLTFKNYETRNAFTINIPSADFATEVDYLGIVSGKEEPEKLNIADLDTMPGHKVDAPIIMDCPINIECKGREIVVLGTHNWVIGEILEVHIHNNLVDEGGKIDIETLDPMIYCPSDKHYYHLGDPIARAFYAGLEIKKKPEKA